MADLKNKNAKYFDLAKNMMLFSVSSFGTKIISFLFIPLYTAVLSTDEYGSADLLSSTVSLLIPVLSLNIQDAVMRFSLDKDYKKEDVISTGVRINFYGLLFLALGITALSKVNILKLESKWLVFLFITYATGVFNNCFTLYLKGKEKVSVLAVSGILNTFFSSIFNVIFLLIIKAGIDGYLLAHFIGSFIAVMYQLFAGKIYKDIKLLKFQDLSKKMIGYSLPLVANSLSWWINNASDRYILTFLCGVAQNGIYSMAYKIPTILSTIQTIFYNAWSISAVKEFDKDDKDGFIGNMYSMYSFLSIIACSVIMIFNVPIARILYAEEFFVAWKCVPFLLVGTVFNGIALFQGCIFTAVKQTKAVSITTMIGAAVNTVCNVVCIFFMGSIGAALATLIGYMVTWILRLMKLKKIVHMKVEWNRHFLCIGLLILQALLALDTSLTIMQIVLFGIMILLQRKQLKKIIRR